jgi:hypothetical protein
VYPYRTRTHWFLASRYAHLVRALDGRRRQLQDSTLEARVDAIRFWNRIHSALLILLSIGFAATVAAWVAGFIPAFEAAAEAVSRVTAVVGISSGFLTIIYLFITRLLGQLEMDVVAILTVDHNGRP